MGIKCKQNIMGKNQDEFHRLDKTITGYAFDIHNEIGRFYDEKIYQRILAEKCHLASINNNCEVEVVATFKDFIKTYKIDLLVESGIIYELKTVKALNEAHKQQLINYLLLTGIKYGKLLNFRPASVEYKFVSTTLTTEDRYDYSVDKTEWNNVTEKCDILYSVLVDLLSEWGAFLDYRLFNEALVYFLGGDEQIIQPVQIVYNNKIVGEQKMQLLNNETAFHLSGITKIFKGYENHLRRLITQTTIKNVQWVNFDKHNITMKTITK
jgi:GxxExxY protein